MVPNGDCRIYGDQESSPHIGFIQFLFQIETIPSISKGIGNDTHVPIWTFPNVAIEPDTNQPFLKGSSIGVCKELDMRMRAIMDIGDSAATQ